MLRRARRRFARLIHPRRTSYRRRKRRVGRTLLLLAGLGVAFFVGLWLIVSVLIDPWSFSQSEVLQSLEIAAGASGAVATFIALYVVTSTFERGLRGPDLDFLITATAYSETGERVGWMMATGGRDLHFESFSDAQRIEVQISLQNYGNESARHPAVIIHPAYFGDDFAVLGATHEWTVLQTHRLIPPEEGDVRAYHLQASGIHVPVTAVVSAAMPVGVIRAAYPQESDQKFGQPRISMTAVADGMDEPLTATLVVGRPSSTPGHSHAVPTPDAQAQP